MSLEVRPAREDDLERFVAIEAQSFNVPPSGRDFIRSLPPSEIRVVEERGEILAALRVIQVSQLFGGRAVPCGAIASVAVAAEARGRGVAETLVAETLRELRAAGTPISSLYPATVPIYRRCGYEYAAARTMYRAPLRSLPRDGALDPEPWDDGALPDVDACYRASVEGMEGPIVRTPLWWAGILRAHGDQEVYRYLVRERGRVTGAIVFVQEPSKESRYRYDLTCSHLSWCTREAGRSLLALAGRHRSLGNDLIWFGPPADPLVNLMTEQDGRPEWSFRLMTRLVDLPAAFEARGFRPDAHASFDLAVEDQTLPENAGPWRIEVSDGRAKVTSASSAAARADAGALAAIWTGMLGARDAARTGRLEADDRTIEALEGMLAGRPPWVEEMF